MHGNSTTFVGNVAQEPRSVNSGKSVKLSIGWNERPKPDGTKGRTVFMDVFVNGKQGTNVLESVKVGDRVIVIGSMSSYLDKNHNISRHSITAEIVGKSLEFDVVGGRVNHANDDDDDYELDDDEDEEAPAPAPKPARTSRVSRAKAKPAISDDEDDDAIF